VEVRDRGDELADRGSPKIDESLPGDGMPSIFGLRGAGGARLRAPALAGRICHLQRRTVGKQAAGHWAASVEQQAQMSLSVRAIGAVGRLMERLVYVIECGIQVPGTQQRRSRIENMGLAVTSPRALVAARQQPPRAVAESILAVSE
jgi:hypothetical protein